MFYLGPYALNGATFTLRFPHVILCYLHIVLCGYVNGTGSGEN